MACPLCSQSAMSIARSTSTVKRSPDPVRNSSMRMPRSTPSPRATSRTPANWESIPDRSASWRFERVLPYSSTISFSSHGDPCGQFDRPPRASTSYAVRLQLVVEELLGARHVGLFQMLDDHRDVRVLLGQPLQVEVVVQRSEPGGR